MICRIIITHLIFEFHSFIIILTNTSEGVSMSCLAIISEYNPYHNGHAYLLREAKARTGAGHSLSVMSGNFSQQGSPMLFPKLLRASAASASGIDLVFELPVLVATGSAGDFASGAVSLLNRLHCVDYLCFGVEDENTELFHRIAECLADESPEYQSVLSDAMRDGKSFPAARENALAAILGDEIRPILQKPNNILALEYITALTKTGSTIRPVLIRRKGSYHPDFPTDRRKETNLSQNDGFLSATEIRNRIEEFLSSDQITGKEKENNLSDYLLSNLPEESFKIILPEITTMLRYSSSAGMSDFDDRLTPYLVSTVVNAKTNASHDYVPEDENLPMDMSRDLLRRLMSLPLPLTWNEAVDHLNTRDMTKGRVRRALLHFILGITDQDRTMIRSAGNALYANLLSARKESTYLLRSIQETAEIPIITTRSAFIPEKESPASRLWALDIAASDLYHQMYCDTWGIRNKDELRSTPVII